MIAATVPEIFEEVETRRMNAAFDAAWDFIEESDSVLSSPDKSDGTRELLALAVIKHVRTAQPTVESLRNAALEELGFAVVDVICPLVGNDPGVSSLHLGERIGSSPVIDIGTSDGR